MVSPPLVNFFVRGPDGLSLLVGPPFDGDAVKKLDKISCTSAKFTSDGSKLTLSTPEAVVIYDAESSKKLLSLPIPGATATSFSPCGTYLQTFQKPTGQEKNLTLWDIKSGAVIFQQFQKTMSKTNWPAIQFSDDEALACRLVTNEVHLYDGRDFQRGIIDKLRLPGIAGVQLAHAPGTHLAVYVPEIKGAPASARIFEVAQVSQGEPVARRSFFKSSAAKLVWNKGSTGLLVLATSDVDKTNQNYYGESRLHFLSSNGKHEGAVPLNKEGPIYDVQWSPSGKEFIVVYGFMPAKATLFDAECRAKFEFGSGPYNTVRWNPHEHFICLAGFGNLPGDMAFWDLQTLKVIGNTKAECAVTSEWSPDGRYLMIATTAPRLQVDNGIRFFKYDGTLYHEKKYEKLYQAEWRPASADLYEDRPPSPTSSRVEKKQEQKSAAPGKLAVKPAAYRPPNASNSAAVKAQDRSSIDSGLQNAGKMSKKLCSSRTRALLGISTKIKLFGEDEKAPGAGLSKSALKNQRRRASKQKESAETPSAKSTTDAPHNQDADGTGVSALDAQLEGTSLDAVVSGTDVAKKLRALHKKLRQLDELKSESKALTPVQIEKLAQESTLRAEIKALEAQQASG